MLNFNYLVDGIIPKGASSLLLGRPGRGKSWLALAIAVAVATGAKCLGKFDTIQTPVVIIDEDTPTMTLEWRLQRFLRSLNMDRSQVPLHLWSMTGWRLDIPTDIDKLINFVSYLNTPVLVVIDCLDSVLCRFDSNRTKDASAVGQTIATIKNAGITPLLVHHMSAKGLADDVIWRSEGDFTRFSMGNTKLIAFSDTVLGMWQLSEEPTVFVVRTKARRIPLEVPEKFAVYLREGMEKTWVYLEYDEELPVIPSAEEIQIAGLFISNPGAKFTVKDTMNQTGELLAIADLRLILKGLEKHHIIKLWRQPHNLYLYGLDPGFYSLHSHYSDAIRKGNS